MKPRTGLTRWLCLAFVGHSLAAQAGPAVDPASNPWQALTSNPTNAAGAEIWIQPAAFHAFSLDHARLRGTLVQSPKASLLPAAFSKSELAIPMPDGTVSRFRIVESPVMAPELAAKFPQIKTYFGQGIDDPSATVRFDFTPAGFHAQILSPDGAVYVDPHFRGDTNLYVSYFKRDYRRDAADFQCFTEGGEPVALSKALDQPSFAAGGTLRTYRLAVAATGEYTAYHGGTIAAGMAAIVTAINRVTGVYQSEVGVQLQLVANNNLIVYTNGAADPYSNASQTLLLSQNQSNIDAVIGSANYDIGHVFSTAGGGLATVGCVCVSGLKARGETGTSAPKGDAFYIDYVAHEMGHQFGAYHTFNSTTSSCGGVNRTAADAYEPGSGSTIMAYAGICGGDNLQAHSDPYFHSASLEEIISYITTGAGSGCPATSATGNNPPAVSAGNSYTIPKGTPFVLTATGSDPDADALTYCWEERDLGPSATLNAADNGSSPLFRSFNPVTSSSRTFPRLSDILGNTTTSGELLPAMGRIMSFRVVARDNRAGGGGSASADVQITVLSNAGPFSVTTPATSVTWSNMQTVAWNVANTTAGPIGATNVNILLSTNGGTTFPIVLAANVANNGSRTVQLPSVSTSQARIEVQAAGNIFFAISRSNFTIVPSSADLAVGMVASTNLVNVGDSLSLTISVTNLGPLTAGGVVVTSTSPASLSCVSASCSLGSCATNNLGCNCALGMLTNGARASITLVMRALAPGYATNPVVVASAANDPVTSNNTAAAVVVVNSSPAISPVADQVALEDGAAGPIPFIVFDADLPPEMLVVAGSATDTNLVPNAGIVFGGSGSNRTVTITPAAHHYGATAITLTVSDGVAVTNTSFLLTVTQSNHAPSLAAIGEFTVLETIPFSFTNLAGDVEVPAQLLTYSLTNAPVGAVIDPVTGVFTWTPSESQGPAPNFVTVIVTDNGSPPLSDAKTFSIVVLESNLPPVLPEQGDQTLSGLSTLVVTNTAFDADIPANALTYNLAGPTNSMIDPNGVITWTPQPSQVPSTNVFTTIVSDANPDAVNATSRSATNSFLVVVTPIHNGPVLAAIEEQFVNELSSFVFTNSASDADLPALNLTYELVNAPDGATIDTNGVIRWSPREDQAPATYDLVTVVTDSGIPPLSATNHITVNAREINSAPGLPAQTNWTISGLGTLVVTNTALDTDVPVNLLSYALASAPTNAVIDTNGVITWTPVAAQVPSTNYFATVVTDYNADAVNEPNLSATNGFLVVVQAVHNGPSLPYQPDRMVDELSALVVTNTAQDSDIPALALTYELLAPPAGATIDTNGVIRWTPTQAQAGTTNVIVTVVTDSGTPALSATNGFIVVVNDLAGRVPMLVVIGDRTVREGETLVITNAATGPGSDSEPLTYGLAEGSPVGAAIDATNGVFVWTPSETQGPSTNLITVMLTNGAYAGYITTQSFTVTVLESNLPPVLLPVADRVVHAGMVVIITNTATDPDLPANVLSFDLQPGAPLSATIGSDTGLFTWATTDADANTTNVITIKVTDDGLPKMSDVRSFSVIVAPRPVFTAITRTNDVVELRWTAIAGLNYELQYSGPETSQLWTNLQTVVAGGNGTASGTDAVSFAEQRLYRVRVVP